MRKFVALVVLLIAAGLNSASTAPAVDSGDQGKVARLIEQLGSRNFRERDAASKELDGLGETALEELRKAVTNSDMEIANRAATLVAKIEQRVENAALLSPSYVELNLKDAPVEEAVADLAAKSGYAIVIGGNKAKLVGRKVTIQTGKIPFWKALEMLCDKADLMESALAVDPRAEIQPLPPVRVMPAPLPIPVKPINNKPIQNELPKPRENPVPKAPEGFSADAPAQKAPAKEEVPPQAQAQPPLQPAQPVQLQFAVQPAIALRQPLQSTNAAIVLVDGRAKPTPMHVEGAVRIRAMESNAGPVPQSEIGLLLEVKAEPKIQVQQLLGVKIDKAIDNSDRHLEQALVGGNNGLIEGVIPQNGQIKQRVLIASSTRPVGMGSAAATVPVRLKKGDGENESTSIKELQGTVSLKIRTPMQPIIVVENILTAKGETAKGKGDATLKIIDVTKKENGDIKVEVELRHSHEIQTQDFTALGGRQGIIIQGNVQIQIGPGGAQGGPFVANGMAANQLGLEMLDNKDVSLKLVEAKQSNVRWEQNGRSLSAALTFHPAKDQEPAKLVFKGSRLATVDVPFTLKEVAVK